MFCFHEDKAENPVLHKYMSQKEVNWGSLTPSNTSLKDPVTEYVYELLLFTSH